MFLPSPSPSVNVVILRQTTEYIHVFLNIERGTGGDKLHKSRGNHSNTFFHDCSMQRRVVNLPNFFFVNNNLRILPCWIQAPPLKQKSDVHLFGGVSHLSPV